VSATARGGEGTPASDQGAGVSSFGARRRLALVAAAGCAALALACGAPEQAPRVEFEGGAVDLEGSTIVHEVSLERRTEGVEVFVPAVIEAAAGDAVRFTSQTLDTHALAFRMNRLSPEQQSFLARSGQEASTPILERGHAWVLTLEGAPAGAYPFVCLIHDAEGTLEVAGPR